jgi:1,4-dihydroxy-2-naphthoyl-CoA hydrolase
MPFVHTETVRLAHVDAAGILYFARIFELCHAAMEAAMSAAGRPLSGFFRDPTWVMPVVHAEADYKRPLKLDDEVRIEVVLELLSDRRLAWRFTALGPSGKPHAVATQVHVAVDAASFRPTAIPNEWLTALSDVVEVRRADAPDAP